MLEILHYPFMQRAILAGIILSGVFAFLGVYVLLRRMAFFADGIAHGSLSGIALGIVFSWYPLAAALVVSACFALIIYYIEKKFTIASDTVIGIIFTSGMALGVLLISIQPGYQPELISFLFGNILAVTASEIWLIAAIAAGVVLFVICFYKQLILLSLDEELAHVSGIKTNVLQPLFYLVLAVTVVLGLKILGAILVSALLILPAASAQISARSFKTFVVFSIIYAEIITVGGIMLSYALNWPTGSVIVLVGALWFMAIAGVHLFVSKKI